MQPADAPQDAPETVADQSLRVGLNQPDHQARTLYDAERRFQSDPPLGHKRFANTREAQIWLRALTATAELRDAYPHAGAWLDDHPVTTKRSTAKRRIAGAETGTAKVVLSSHDDGVGLVLPVVVHEFAHVVHGANPADRLQQSHGPEFASVYLDMVAIVCGGDEAERLRGDFVDNGVDVDDAARRVTDPTAGLLAARKLPRPTSSRTPSSVAAARAARFAAAAERQAKKILKRSDLASLVRGNRLYFSKALDAGADLPPQILKALAPDVRQPPAPQPQRTLRRCNKRMPRAKRRCMRGVGHRGHCA